MKFLVIWEFNPALLGSDMIQSVLRMPDYAKKLRDQGKLTMRYHIVGKHGGAWIYDVQSHEEMERLLAMAPVYNYARYNVYPLAEMDTPANVLQTGGGKTV